MNVRETSEAISNMTVRGAGRIARAGASALREMASGYKGKDLEKFRNDLKEAANELISSRPTAVSLRNGVQASLKGMNSSNNIDDVKAIVISNADSFIKRSEAAVDAIAKIGAKRIKDGDNVMTHCNSSAAIAAITEAHRQGKKIKVFATESRPWRQGILTVNELSKAGVDTTLIIDSAVRTVMKDTDIVLVGADTVTAHGALINKIGTSQVALAANETRVPFVVCAETYKFSPMTLLGDMVTIEERDLSEIIKKGEIPDAVKVFNPVFDTTPAKYIDAIVTELGMIHPAAAHEMMIREFGEMIFNITE